MNCMTITVETVLPSKVLFFPLILLAIEKHVAFLPCKEALRAVKVPKILHNLVIQLTSLKSWTKLVFYLTETLRVCNFDFPSRAIVLTLTLF